MARETNCSKVKLKMDGCEHKVAFRWHTANTLRNITIWCQQHCTGNYTYQYTAPNIWFEKEQDAVIFRLVLPNLR